MFYVHTKKKQNIMFYVHLTKKENVTHFCAVLTHIKKYDTFYVQG